MLSCVEIETGTRVVSRKETLLQRGLGHGDIHVWGVANRRVWLEGSYVKESALLLERFQRIGQEWQGSATSLSPEENLRRDPAKTSVYVTRPIEF